MVVHGGKARQLSLGLFPEGRVQRKPEPMQAPESTKNSARLKIEIAEFLLSKSNSSFNSLLSLIGKARPEAANYFRAELCRIFSARMEGEKAILEKIPSNSQIEDAWAILRGLENCGSDFRKNTGNYDWRWKAVSAEEQDSRYALDRYSALCLLSGLNSLFEQREYRDLILVLDLAEKEAGKAASRREYGKPRVSKYEQYICNELQHGISGKVKQLAELEDKN